MGTSELHAAARGYAHRLSYTLLDAFLGFGDLAFTVPLAQLFEKAGTDQERGRAA